MPTPLFLFLPTPVVKSAVSSALSTLYANLVAFYGWGLKFLIGFSVYLFLSLKSSSTPTMSTIYHTNLPHSLKYQSNHIQTTTPRSLHHSIPSFHLPTTPILHPPHHIHSTNTSIISNLFLQTFSTKRQTTHQIHPFSTHQPQYTYLPTTIIFHPPTPLQNTNFKVPLRQWTEDQLDHMELRCYSPAFHQASFSLPTFAAKLLN